MLALGDVLMTCMCRRFGRLMSSQSMRATTGAWHNAKPEAHTFKPACQDPLVSNHTSPFSQHDVPAFKLAATPRLRLLLISRTLASCFAIALSRAAVPSVDPSSTMMSSSAATL